ncbi:MAG: S8 family peptidase [Flavobacteriales bacterium]|nr:S8 family peptidase [Flavobacteriales bacterium]
MRSLPLLLLFLTLWPFTGQELAAQTAPATYWIQFTDKDDTPYSLTAPEAFLSTRAIERRQLQGIPIDSLDLPVNPAYISDLLASGEIQLVNRHKWFNAVTIRSTDTLALDTLHMLPFVAEVRLLHDGHERPLRAINKFPEEKHYVEVGGHFQGRYGASLRQVALLNAHLLHEAGAEGQGLLIGVMDSGFENVDLSPAFKELRDRGGIVLTRDLAYPDGDVYRDHWHGRSVLSCIAGHIPGALLGTAPAVNVALFRTEVNDSEYIWEEDNWVAAAELADSLGCDILNTSLGYTTFDDSTQDHRFEDMNGRTARISIAAGIAARKGMIPVTSAGNAGTSEWYHISAPADAEDILAVGAVNVDRLVADFSSRGPSADGRVKPDVCAVGWSTVGLSPWGEEAIRINGTSFSSPLLAGGVACLWQLHRDRTAHEVMDAVRRSASHHDRPDPAFGHGIPDLWRAHLMLGGTDLTGLTTASFLGLWPTTVTDHFTVELYTGDATQLEMDMVDAAGRVVWQASRPVNDRSYLQFRVQDGALLGLKAGVYLLRATLGSEQYVQRLVKVRP